MNIQEISLWFGEFGALASILGLIVAWIQTIRIRKVKQEEKLDVWNTIRYSKQIKSQLSKNSALDDPNIARAYEANLSLFRTQLKRAVLLEKDYSLKTIEKWKSERKVDTDWEEKQAMNYLG